MTLTPHTAVALILSTFTNNPIISFISSFISHAILDTTDIQEYKINAFNLKRDINIILVEIALTGTLIYISLGDVVKLSAVIGGLIPDIIDGILSIIDNDRYYTGNHLFWFHRPKGNTKSLSKAGTMVLSIILFIIAFLVIKD